MTGDCRPVVASNRGGGTVAAALCGYWQHLHDDRVGTTDLAIATAYFNVSGWHMLADQLEQAGSVRLLLGAEPDVAAELSVPRSLGGFPGDERSDRLRAALGRHHDRLATDRNLVAFRPDTDDQVRRLLHWLGSQRVQVRRLEDDFLHGKAYVVETKGHGVLVGSSNLTRAGLTRNVELNLGNYEPLPVAEVQDWFDELWDEATDYDLAALYEDRFTVHEPFVIFLRMLWERYRDELDDDGPLLGLPLTEFQRDGVTRAIRLLQRYGGVLVADGVGLGKTYVAGELMRRANRELRQRVLLVAPAALLEGPWRQFRAEHDRDLHVDAVSYDALAADPRLGGDGRRAQGMRHDPDDYALVVIDEAHAYRNTGTRRHAALQRLLGGTPQKRLVLLTATPVNNSLSDLHTLLSTFIRNDAAFIDRGIPSLRKRFAQAEAMHADDLSPDLLFDVLDAVAVRRTRRFVKRFYSGATLPGGGVIRFPQPVVERVDYDLDTVLPGFFNDFAYALGVDPADPDTPIPDPTDFDYTEQLSLARYAPSAWALDGAADQRELQAAGLLRSGLLKRFESSAYAFARTCRTMAASHDRFLAALDAGWVLTGDALAAYEMTDSDEFNPDLIAVGGTREPAGSYEQQALRRAVVGDRDLLVSFAERAETITPSTDPKLEALKDALGAIAAHARDEGVGDRDVRTKRKVLLFSYYQDTVQWIAEHLRSEAGSDPRLADFAGRIVVVSGSDGDKRDAMFGFAPVSTGAPSDEADDRYDLLISTDVLAEGVNLQQARHIINYDLPWNPMRLVQRHGRIDRIGSPHDRVWLRCFFPSRMLDDLLGLEEAIRRKVAKAAKSIGVEGEIVPGSAVNDVVFSRTSEQVRAVHDEDAVLFEQDAGSVEALSGEEFRRILADGMADAARRDRVLDLPWVAGSGVEVDRDPGFVFCARVGDHDEPVFRWVPTTTTGELVDVDDTVGVPGEAAVRTEGLSRDTLTALAMAQADARTERCLPDAWRSHGHAAWAAARDDIFRSWDRHTDPQAMATRVPKPMREAVALLDEHAPADWEQAHVDRLRASLQADYLTREQRAVRNALRSSEDPAARVEALVRVVEELGLEPPPPVETLPEIAIYDIHLVCWMARVPPEPMVDGASKA